MPILGIEVMISLVYVPGSCGIFTTCIVLKSYPIYTLHNSATLTTVTIVGFPRVKPVVLG